MKIKGNKIILTFQNARDILDSLKNCKIKKDLSSITPKKKTKSDYNIQRIQSIGYKVTNVIGKKYRAEKDGDVIYGTLSGIHNKLFYTKNNKNVSIK